MLHDSASVLATTTHLALHHVVLHTAFLGIPNPFSWLTGHVAGLAVKGFEAIIKALFAPIAKFIDAELIRWLVAVPNLTQGRVSSLETTVEAIAGGLLGAVATISIARYWAAGLAGGGTSGFAALEGLVRTIAAVLFLASWRWGFDAVVRLVNLLTGALLGSGTVTHDVSHLLAAGAGASLLSGPGPLGLFIGIVAVVAATLLFLGLLLMKLVVTISTLLVFMGMPLAIVAWPVAPWVARAALRAFAVCLMVPVLWVLCFTGAAAVADNSTLFDASGVANALLQPLVAVMLLYVMLKVPTHLARVAMLGAAPLGGGAVSRAVSYAAGSQVRQTVTGALNSGRQQATPASDQGSNVAGPPRAPADATTRRQRGAAVAGTAATGGTSAAAAAVAAQGASASGIASAATGGAAGGGGVPVGWANAAVAGGRSSSRTPVRQIDGSVESQHGLPQPAWHQEAVDREMAELSQRAPVSAQRAQQAFASLPGGYRREVEQLSAQHGAGARQHLAYRATGESSPQNREALRDLAAATPEVRSQAITRETTANVGGGNDGAEALANSAAAEHESPSPNSRAGLPTEQPAITPKAEREVDGVEQPNPDSRTVDPGRPTPSPPPVRPETTGSGTGVTPLPSAPPSPGNGGNRGSTSPEARPKPRDRPAPREPRGPRPDDLFSE